MTNEDIVRSACQVVWTDGDIDRAGEFYAENYKADYPFANWGTGLEGVKNFAAEIRRAFPDYGERIDELITADDKVIVRLTITGTNTGPMGGFPATGKSVEFRDVTVCRIENGKIAEQWGLSDNLSIYLQLGLIEMPSAPQNSAAASG